LIYGPDAGLVKERASDLAKNWVSDIHDPFSVSVLESSVFDDDAGRFQDEANAQSMMGGDRLLWIKDADSKLAIAVKSYIKSGINPDCLILIEADNLPPKDALRKLCEEASDQLVALPCYVEDEKDMRAFLQKELEAQGFSIQRDVLDILANVIKGDRLRARMEVEKLSLYARGQKQISLEDVKASAGDTGLSSLDDLTYAMTGGNREACLQALSRLLAEDVDPIKILRSLQYHVGRLLQVRAQIDEGVSIDMALRTLQPPLFFKFNDIFKAQVNRHSHENLRKILLQLGDLEARTKKTGAKAETLMAQFLLKIAA
jgi:DNA polymerase-3 subunit delta